MNNQQEQLQHQLQNLNLQPQNNQEQQEHEQSKWQIIKQPQNTVPLFMVDFEHCDSKKCTGKKLQRFKLLTKIKDKKKKFKGIVLSAFAKKYVQREDMEHIAKGGICVIDCSWNRIQETKEFRYKHQRKLPFVVAGNPVNFGKPYQLSCAQALATALCAIGYVPQAKYIMSKFGWAQGFWKQNPYLHLYGNCQNTAQIQQQSKLNEQNREKGFEREYIFPSDSSDQEEQKQQKPVNMEPQQKQEQ